MKDQVKGRPIHRIDEVAAGTLKAADGRPVHAVSTYVDGAPPADGRPLHAASLLLNEGQPSHAVSFYAAGTLMTADGRPVHAVALFDAAGAPTSAVFDPATLFAGTEDGAWYEITSTAGLFQDSAATVGAAVGAVVGYVTDKSGNGYPLLQATTAAKPILRFDNTISKYYLECDGVDDTMASALGITMQVASYVSCAWHTENRGAGTAFGPIFGAFDAATSELGIGLRSQTAVTYSFLGSARYNGGASASVGGFEVSSIGRGTLIELSMDADSIDLYLLDTAAATETRTAAAALTGTDPIVAKLMGLAASGFVGRFYGGLIIADQLTAGERTNARTYMGSQAGVIV